LEQRQKLEAHLAAPERVSLDDKDVGPDRPQRPDKQSAAPLLEHLVDRTAIGIDNGRKLGIASLDRRQCYDIDRGAGKSLDPHPSGDDRDREAVGRKCRGKAACPRKMADPQEMLNIKEDAGGWAGGQHSARGITL